MNNIPINTSVVSGVALTSHGNETQILMMKRSKEKFWCHVAGSIESNEVAWKAIVREFLEETGVTVEVLYSADYTEQFYERDRNCLTIIPVFVTILNSDQKIYLNHEHTEYKWCSLDEAKCLVEYPGQRTLYQYIWDNFVKIKPSELLRIRQS